MPDGASVADADRLPWLEPHREAPAARPRARKPKRAAASTTLTAVAVTALFVAAGGGGYWLGQQSEPNPSSARQAAPVPTLAPPPSQATVALPSPMPLAEPVRPAEAQPNAGAPAIEPVAEPQRRTVAKAAKKKPVRRYRAKRKIRSAGVETARIGAVRAEQERPAARSGPVSSNRRVWPRLPSPGPAGQVIQLGAFTHPNRAYRAYQARLDRYPTLTRMPRVIVPVVPRANGKMYYVLRLGISSRQQSKSICRNLRRSGDHCIAIG